MGREIIIPLVVGFFAHRISGRTIYFDAVVLDVQGRRLEGDAMLFERLAQYV